MTTRLLNSNDQGAVEDLISSRKLDIKRKQSLDIYQHHMKFVNLYLNDQGQKNTLWNI